MAGTIPADIARGIWKYWAVSMESGLDGRNNCQGGHERTNHDLHVSMESGLDGRNNSPRPGNTWRAMDSVSMESGLDGRNNVHCSRCVSPSVLRLNGVRPRWPEQLCRIPSPVWRPPLAVSMESGLDGRNNCQNPAV